MDSRVQKCKIPANLVPFVPFFFFSRSPPPTPGTTCWLLPLISFSTLAAGREKDRTILIFFSFSFFPPPPPAGERKDYVGRVAATLDSRPETLLRGANMLFAVTFFSIHILALIKNSDLVIGANFISSLPGPAEKGVWAFVASSSSPPGNEMD